MEKENTKNKLLLYARIFLFIGMSGVVEIASKGILSTIVGLAFGLFFGTSTGAITTAIASTILNLSFIWLCISWFLYRKLKQVVKMVN